jgi:hypothetical protein
MVRTNATTPRARSSAAAASARSRERWAPTTTRNGAARSPASRTMCAEPAHRVEAAQVEVVLVANGVDAIPRRARSLLGAGENLHGVDGGRRAPRPGDRRGRQRQGLRHLGEGLSEIAVADVDPRAAGAARPVAANEGVHDLHVGLGGDDRVEPGDPGSQVPGAGRAPRCVLPQADAHAMAAGGDAVPAGRGRGGEQRRGGNHGGCDERPELHRRATPAAGAAFRRK